ncbi:MAG: hypothetical protein JSR63_11095 [Proteobacteria bacterium]|nr:hypothetical protein [Pseudomonadota bacterium]MBS0218703.1 hypothetical protein [Pseudomonadota bacterium]
MNSLGHTPQRDRAWGRYYARNGAHVITHDYFEKLSNAARIALYQMRRAGASDASRYVAA